MSDILKNWGTPMPIPIQKGRLGRGLASLIGETPEADARLPAHGEQRLLSLDQLHPSGHNPRKSFDDLELIDLTDSIRQKGLYSASARRAFCCSSSGKSWTVRRSRSPPSRPPTPIPGAPWTAARNTANRPSLG